MRLLVQTAAFVAWTASVCAVALPEKSSLNDVVSVAGFASSEDVSISFSTPCPGCAIGVVDELEFHLVIPKSHGECSGPNPTLNGMPLDLSFQGHEAHGSGSWLLKSSLGLGTRPLELGWRSFCVQGEGQVLSVRILHATSGEHDSGFTVSFKQDGVPSILRLRNEPDGLVLRKHDLDLWMHPSNENRLRIQLLLDHESSPLEVEFAKLEDIKRRMGVLRAVLREQEHTIMQILKQDFKQCEGFQCILETAMQKAPDFAHLIAEHFTHEKVQLGASEQFNEVPLFGTLSLPESAEPNRPKKENPAPPALPPFDGDHDRHSPPFPDHPPFHHGEYPPPPPPPPHHGEHPPKPPPPHHGEHPPPPPPHHGEHPPPQPPPPHHEDGPDGPPGHHRPQPSFFHRVRSHRFRILKAVLALLAGSFLLTVAFHCLPCFNTPRRRLDRATRREERRVRCQYRRAAHRQRLASWWATHNPRSHFRFRALSKGTSDYDEKRALILAQEGILEAAMQAEIRSLENAAELEDGRGRGRARFPSAQALNSSASGSGSTSSRRHDNFPSSSASSDENDYSAPPPRYEAELDDEMIPVDGFMYNTPSGSASTADTDETPESSVVDFSPRMSWETLQTSASLGGKSERD